jgi:hypothetical protein
MADDEEQPDSEDEADFPDPQPSTPIDVPDLRVETNVDLTPNEPEPEPPPAPLVPQFIPPMLPPAPVLPVVNQPPEQPPQPVRPAQTNAPPMPPDPYDTRGYGGSPPTHPMPPDKYDPFPKAQGPEHPEQNSLWGAINQLFDWLNITHRKLHEVWPPRGSDSGAGDAIIDIRYNSTTHKIETTTDGTIWTAKISFTANTFTSVTSNTYNTSTHTFNYITSTFTAYIPEAIGGVANSPAVFETAVSGSCT